MPDHLGDDMRKMKDEEKEEKDIKGNLLNVFVFIPNFPVLSQNKSCILLFAM